MYRSRLSVRYSRIFITLGFVIAGRNRIWAERGCWKVDGSISVDLGRLGCLVLRMVVQEGGQRGASLQGERVDTWTKKRNRFVDVMILKLLYGAYSFIFWHAPFIFINYIVLSTFMQICWLCARKAGSLPFNNLDYKVLCIHDLLKWPILLSTTSFFKHGKAV